MDISLQNTPSEYISISAISHCPVKFLFMEAMSPVLSLKRLLVATFSEGGQPPKEQLPFLVIFTPCFDNYKQRSITFPSRQTLTTPHVRA